MLNNQLENKPLNGSGRIKFSTPKNEYCFSSDPLYGS
jgi:hypothetical protein